MAISINNQQALLTIDTDRLEQAVDGILKDAGYGDAEVSLAIVDDPTIHQLNRQHLDHDYPTDVLSFLLEERPATSAGELAWLSGEVIVSTDTASENAAEYGWRAADELLLYVIHGTLHLVGYRDKAPDEIAAMRAAENKYLKQWGLVPPDTDEASLSDGPAADFFSGLSAELPAEDPPCEEQR